MKKEIKAERLGENHGPFTHGIIAGDYLFSTHVGLLPDGTMAGPGIYEQTIQTIHNMMVVLEDAGASINDIVKVTIYIIDLKKNLAEMNRAYRELIPNNPFPARACVEVADMVDDGALVEMEFTVHLKP